MVRKKLIAAYFMHEEEEAFAHDKLENIEVTGGMCVGKTDEAGIKALRKKGLIVEELGDVEPQRRPRALAMTGVPRVVVPAQFEVGVRGPLTPARRNELESIGAQLLERLGDSILVFVATVAQFRALSKLPFVDSVRESDPATEAAPPRPRSKKKARRAGAPRGLAGSPPVADSDAPAELAKIHDVVLREGGDLDVVKRRIESHAAAQVVGSSRRKVRALMPASLAADLRDLSDVEIVSEVGRRTLRNDVARRLTGAREFVAYEDGGRFSLTGDGEIVAVADSGIDESHPDFSNRIVQADALGRPNDASDVHGHGTHVAGTVLGDGHASGGKLAGVAPEARLYFQSLEDPFGGLGGLPMDLSDLFRKPYAKGARVHNNSWGADLFGRFTVDSLEVDRFTWEHPDMLIVIAAGNAGSLQPSESHPRQTPRAEVELLSVGTPATSKNALVVGASRTKRSHGGLASYTHADAWPGDFDQSSGVSSERISGDPEELAGFSSRGPSDDERIKPDVVAPGTDILSARSKDAPSSSFWGTYSKFSGRYAYMGGTSMAAPHVAGCAALVREYYRKARSHDPSAALVKATLINGARPLTGAGAIAAPKGSPNFHQGFGCVDLERTLPSSAQSFQLAFVDTWQTANAGLADGDRHRWRIRVDREGPICVCFSYSDAPGRSLQNVLYLILETPDGQKLVGNRRGPRGLIVGPDKRNNAQIVRIEAAVPGDYMIQVAPWSMLRGPQHYGLVATGFLEGLAGGALIQQA